MLSLETNELLTGVGPDTPMGELLRRYWHPVGAVSELDDQSTKPVRILGEDLVLFKDLKGRVGLIERACAHRRVDLSYGLPEEEGLRCAYHGWVYDTSGQCVEQPFEEAALPGGGFKNKVRLTAYPVQELGGLLFAYMGPDPAPLLPRWDLLLWDNVVRDIEYVNLPCNWLQIMENSVDPVHFQWLHRYLSSRIGASNQGPGYRNHQKIGFDIFEYGIIKRRLSTGETEDDPEWRVGHPLVFPNILRLANQLQIRVPVDDTHTMHWLYTCHVPPEGVTAPAQDRIPAQEVPMLDANGRHLVNFTNGQDMMAWVTQGPIAKREREKLGQTDVGLILYRRMLQEQMAIVKDGGDPMNVFRDPERNQVLPLFHAASAVEASRRVLGDTGPRGSGVAEIVKEMFAQSPSSRD